MAVTNKQIIPGANLTASDATYYTVPASTACIIRKLTCTNYSAAPVTVTINLVPSGGSSQNANLIAKTQVISAGETFGFYNIENHVLMAGDKINALASAATSVNIIASGAEIV